MLFSKKIRIQTLMNQSVDMHNHILPGIDDGAADLEASIDLIQKYKELGYTKIIATPHTMGDFYPNTANSILMALDKVQKELVSRDIKGIEIKAASEYMVDLEFEEMIDRGDKLLTLNDNHILVEMSYLRESENLNQVLYKLQLKNFLPILAHPERYSFYLSDFEKYYAIKKQGVKFQLNMLALTDHYGSKIKKVATRLLKENMYDFVGIDTHRIDHLEKVAKIKIPDKFRRNIKRLLVNNEDLY